MIMGNQDQNRELLIFFSPYPAFRHAYKHRRKYKENHQPMVVSVPVIKHNFNSPLTITLSNHKYGTYIKFASNKSGCGP